MKTGSQNFLCTGHLNWRTCGSISSSLSPTRQENAGLPSRHHWLGSEEHFKEFFMGFQRFKSLALKWSLEDFSTMIQIWMKNGVKKTPLIKRFTTMPIIRAERKLNKTFTSQKGSSFIHLKNAKNSWVYQWQKCNFHSIIFKWTIGQFS